VFARVSPLAFLMRVNQEISDDGLFIWAAALAYSWLFAIFPFFIFLLTLVPHMHRITEHAEAPVYAAIDRTLPPATAETLKSNIIGVIHQTHNGLLSFGIIVAIWAASGGMNMTLSALERIYDVPKPRPFWRQRPLAVVLTLFVALAVIAVLLLLPIGSLITHYIERHTLVQLSKGIIFLWNLARWALALVLMFAIVAILYYFGPSVKQRFRPISPGAVFTVAAWVILGIAFRLYVEHFGKYDKTYGTVGGVVILLTFFYIDAVVLLIGAEINSEIDFALGVQRGSMDFRHPVVVTSPDDKPAPGDPEMEDAAVPVRRSLGKALRRLSGLLHGKRPAVPPRRPSDGISMGPRAD
jgi:membrane protein